MWNFLPGKKKKQEAVIQPIHVDLHSHLIPGVDDGAQNDTEALALLRGLVALGYRKCITTPHCYHALYNNSVTTISPGLTRLKDICTAHDVPLEVEAAAEYFFDNNFFELVEKRELLSFGNKYVLFELPVRNQPVMVEDIARKMVQNGYQPVLAHPERYPYLHDLKMTGYKKLKDQGVLFQVNTMSLTGYYNSAIRSAARDLIRYDMIDFAGSDLHREKQLVILRAAQQDPYYRQLLTSGRLLNNTLQPD